MKNVARHASAVDADDRQLVRSGVVAMDENHRLTMWIDTLIGASLHVKLTTLELDWHHGLHGPIDI